MIGIINYDMGNLRSVQNSLKFCQLDSMIIESAADFSLCDKLILPGVGAFGQGMANLRRKGFVEIIHEQVFSSNKPFMGICLGMQLMLESSCEHGQFEGLGLVKGHVRALSDKIINLPLPHMGWNDVLVKKDSQLFKGITDTNCYFVHSFYCDITDQNLVCGTVNYGFEFAVALESKNLFACQFHPEKSQNSGLQILKNFGGINA